jgi:putative hemolysin
VSEIPKVKSINSSQLLAGRLSDDPLHRRRGRSAVVLVLSVLSVFFASGLGTLAGVSTAAAAPAPWHIATSPDTSTSDNNQLNDVSCTSSTSCVAVGYYFDSSTGYNQNLIETLSGGSWSITTSPDSSTSEDNLLNSVSCTSSTSCVAVGDYMDSSGYGQTLIETLSGGSWAITTSPDTSASESNFLQSVSCTSSTSCVAVGYYLASPYDQTLIETLSGGSWSITTSPDTSSSEDNLLQSVSCTSSTSCVAVGYYLASPYDQTLIETLSGGSWSITTSPDTSTSEDNLLQGVSCTSSTSCVAVGYYIASSGYAQTLIETLSGGSWAITTSPDTSTSEYDQLYGVSCNSSTSCVAVGYYIASSGYNQNLILSTPLPQAITFSPPPPTSALFGSSITLSATGGGSGNPVTFSLDSSSTLGACTLSGTNDSVVTFTGSGNCVIDANQTGNNAYFAAPPVTVTISVTYSEPCLSLSGYHGLTVGSGQAICTTAGAVIGGPITVLSGGSLDIEGAAVYGSINSNGAGVVRICGAKINGSLTVSSTTGPVIIGDEAIGCAGNTINGPVSITNNTGGVTFDDNTVNGPAMITGNSPSLAFFGNTVTGALTIS